MDYGFSNNPHVYAAPQPQPHSYPQPPQPPQPHQPPQPPQPAGAYPYSSYYSTANPNPYPYQVGRHEDPSQPFLFSDSGVVHSADPYAVQTGFEEQAVPYVYQPYQNPNQDPYSYPRTISVTSTDQVRKFMVHSNMLDLESKRQKVIEGGAAADAVRVCAVCNVVCNSDKVFAYHLAGEKHLLKALGRNIQPNVPNVLPHVKKMSYPKKLNPKALKHAAIGVKLPKIIQNFICEVCKIDCNCLESLNSHKMGKKHKANLLKLQQSLAPRPPPASTDKNIAVAPEVEAGKKTSSAKEGLQVKKEKVLKGGADVHSIMECALCDVVCNSKSVYDSHIAGKKHLAMISKQEVRV